MSYLEKIYDIYEKRFKEINECIGGLTQLIKIQESNIMELHKRIEELEKRNETKV